MNNYEIIPHNINNERPHKRSRIDNNEYILLELQEHLYLDLKKNNDNGYTIHLNNRKCLSSFSLYTNKIDEIPSELYCQLINTIIYSCCFDNYWNIYISIPQNSINNPVIWYFSNIFTETKYKIIDHKYIHISGNYIYK